MLYFLYKIKMKGENKMALIKCEECGNNVSDKAKSCPNCGNPIQQKDINNGIEGKQEKIYNVYPIFSIVILLIASFIEDSSICGLFQMVAIILSVIGIFKAHKIKKITGKRKGIILSILILVTFILFTIDEAIYGEAQKVSEYDMNTINQDTIEINYNNYYEYISNTLSKRSKKYSLDITSNDLVIEHNERLGSDTTSQGWINFTQKVYYDCSVVSVSSTTFATGTLTYFDDNFNVKKVYTSSGLQTGLSAVDKYTNAPTGFSRQKGDLSTYQSLLDSEIRNINSALGNEDGKIVLINKTITDLKNEAYQK